MATETSLKTTYRLEIEVLSPVHIGAGRGELLADFDYAFHRGALWIIDQEKMLESVDEEELLRSGSLQPKISRFLQPAQYPKCAVYSLRCDVQAPPTILPFLKDIHARPYLPGSSLKGAIRTALAWGGYGREGAKLTEADLQEDPRRPGRPPDRRRADDRFERRLFGADPNHDVMRALHVGDSAPLAGGSLQLATIVLYTLRDASLQPKGQGYRWQMEVLPPGTSLASTLSVDNLVLGRQAEALGFRSKVDMIQQLAAQCRGQARSVIAHEFDFCGHFGLGRLRQFYGALGEISASLGDGEFLLQMAWGTGWRAKTLGSRIEDDARMAQVRQNYGLGRRDVATFPKTRRVVERGGVAEMPLGWIKVKMA